MILYIFLALALLSTIAVTIMTQQPSGPEGAMGVWFVLMIPCLFLAISVFIMVGKGLLGFIPGGGLVQFAIAVGILITFSIVILGTIDRHNNNWAIQGLVITVPCLILVACTVIIHQTDFPNLRLVYWVAVILLSGAALTGWGLAGTGIFYYIKKDMERAVLRAQEEREQADEREQWEIAEYAKLDDSASLYALLQFIWSRNDQVRQQACEQIHRYPELDDKLIELLDKDCDAAISYIVDLYEDSPAKFAPAWGRMLERQVKKWDNLQYDEHAGTWENNLTNYFEGAQKIQIAGGSLHNELLLWHKHLLKCKGLGGAGKFCEEFAGNEIGMRKRGRRCPEKHTNNFLTAWR